MSHFVCLVIVPAPYNMQRIDQLLAPFSENIEVAPYMTPCYCINSEASRWAVEEHNKRTGFTPSQVREDYWAKADAGEFEPSSEAWERETGWYWNGRKELEKTHARYGQPKANCEECHGSGERETTYNPASKWDWYVVGGRWNGAFDNYDPESDPRNFRTCYLCQGTGKRNDEIGHQFRASNPDYGCNGCNGTGQMLKYSSDWVPQENVRRIDLIRPDFVPFACVTPDGKWYEKGKMGWWAIVSNEAPEGEWEAQYRSLIAQYPEHFGVIVDCHI